MNPNVSADYQRIIHTMKYSRGGRETWGSSVLRTVAYLNQRSDLPPEAQDYLTGEVHDLMKDKRVVPSMRLLASAGPAADQENLMVFNCMFMGIKKWTDFGRLMYALMCGTGVGFSVENIYTSQLYPIESQDTDSKRDITVTFGDSRRSWAENYNKYLLYLLGGVYRNVYYDLQYIRPKGAPLKVTGGYASGPEPLKELLDYTKETVEKMRSTGIHNIYLYDLACKIADVVVQGGVRRSACICLFDYTDVLMWKAKSPLNLQWFPHRHNSNNSVVFPTEDEAKEYIADILELAKETGEPGVVIKSLITGRAEDCGRDPKVNYGLNPCGEIILRDNQVCNLTEVVIRPEYSVEDLMNSVEAAVFLGLLQSKLTKFDPLLLKETKENTEEERLLGVSLTGIMDDPEITSHGSLMAMLHEHAHECATVWAPKLHLPIPKAICCVKPSGSVSKLVDSSAGIHPRFSQYYLSNVGVARGTPLDLFLRNQKVPIRYESEATTIYRFPLKAPEGAITADGLTALDQLRVWKLVNDSWCDHNASCTIYVGEHEWDTVKDWCLENINSLSGVTFMSKFEAIPGSYMPLEKIDQQEYEKRTSEFPVIDWDLFHGDSTLVGTRELACTGGACSL